MTGPQTVPIHEGRRRAETRRPIFIAESLLSESLPCEVSERVSNARHYAGLVLSGAWSGATAA